MPFGFIAYDTNHLKTEQVLSQWSLNAPQSEIQSSKLYLVPFKPRPTREVFLAHRPDQTQGTHSREIANAVGLEVVSCEEASDIPSGMDAYIVLGVGLLPNAFVENNIVINAHPGIIPRARGLDSFKWAIINQERVGVTLHKLSSEVDMGDLWVTKETPVCANDTLEAFARRHYEMEIYLLSHFQNYYQTSAQSVAADKALPATKRMPKEKEEMLWSAFEAYKNRYAAPI